MPRLFILWLFLGAAPALAQPTPPLAIARFVLAVEPRTGTIDVRAVVELPTGRAVERSIGHVAGSCTEDVGGMESIAVVRCTLASGGSLDFELLELRRRVVVQEYRTGRERRLVRSVPITRARPGWTIVPRCAETYADPLACPPSREPVVARLEPCAVELAHTTYDEETRAPTREVHAITRFVDDFGERYRDTDWEDVAPIALTLEAARRLPDASETRTSSGVLIIVPIVDSTLSYRFHSGRTSHVGWDPSADSGAYEYTYSYDCR